MSDIRTSAEGYERWLRRALKGDLNAHDLTEKHSKMGDTPFVFLRASFWRWAETILDVCPNVAGAPPVLAVGDIHLENFGAWRDADGRLIWGVNDFDEAAKMPYALDLIRLATSALLARKANPAGARVITDTMLAGYQEGLHNPGPTVLDVGPAWLRRCVEAGPGERQKFWAKIKKLVPEPAPPRYARALARAMPEPELPLTTAPRTAGTGSLGRPRWIGIADWRGAPVVREAKALVPSAWTLPPGRGDGKSRGEKLALGRYRAPDPWYRMGGRLVVRRLSANSRKIEVETRLDDLLAPRMLRLMGHELASVHLGVSGRAPDIESDLRQRPAGWLARESIAAAEAVTADFRAWRKN